MTTRRADVPSGSPGWLPFGSITDVAGITVGHHQRTGRDWQTGTTVVLANNGATPGVDVRGGGPGTRETDALDPKNLVRTIHGICLTGGSAYGLAAADGVMAWLEAQGLGFPLGDEVIPVVPAAVIFDLGRGGKFANRPDASFGFRAARNARRHQRNWGSHGAGTGARSGGLQGGVGTASTIVKITAGAPCELDTEISVGAIAVVNSIGSTINVATGLPWEPSGLGMRRVGADERRELVAQVAPASGDVGLNTTIGVVATSAQLDKAEAAKLASVAHDGLARAIRPAHGMTDGDTVFALATGADHLSESARIGQFNAILSAAADAFAAACTHAVLAATTLGNAPAYRDLVPAAWK